MALKNNSNNREIWCIGANVWNECGLKSLKTNNKALTLCEWSKNVKSISSIHGGYGFNIYTQSTKDDEYVIYGYIRNIEKLFPFQINSFYIIPSSIILICLQFFGNHYNKYWSLGKNYSGQCGIGDSTDFETVKEINGITNIQKICSGSYASNILWICYDGTLFYNGLNRNNQLGINTENECVTIPTLCTFFDDKSLKCIDAASSDRYCMIVCDDGSVWSSGGGSFGQNGHGHKLRDVEQFTKIEALINNKIIGISVGDSFSIFLSENGDVFSCGCNSDGSLGLGHIEDDSNRLPTKIEYFQKNGIKIKQVECGKDHVISLDINGRIYCWGSNSCGQCGVGIVPYNDDDDDDDKCKLPMFVDSLCNKYVIDIKVGMHHSGCITNDNQYYCWGDNSFNQCMMNIDGIGEVLKPNNINQYVFNTTNSTNIVCMELGHDITMILIEH